MSAPFRIKRHPQQLEAGEGAPPTEGVKKYIDGLVKLIPAEVVGLYLFGRDAITSSFPAEAPAGSARFLSENAAWIGWTLICLIAVIWARCVMTSDRAAGVPPEVPAVGLACISFLVWVYSFGDVFARALNIWDPLIGTLLVAAWTFFAPLIYRPT